jgi:hypothetical protein
MERCELGRIGFKYGPGIGLSSDSIQPLDTITFLSLSQLNSSEPFVYPFNTGIKSLRSMLPAEIFTGDFNV